MKIKKVRKKKTTAKLKKEVWTIFSKWIRTRDNYKCFTCGTKYPEDEGWKIHAGHFITRMHNSTLFDERNVNAQCYACNIIKRGNAGIYAARLMEKYGEGIINELVKKSQEIKQFTPTELEDMKIRYQAYQKLSTG